MVEVVLLCAGYGTRLAKDLEEDNTGIYGHLNGIPKPLLPISGKPLISYWLELFAITHSVSEVTIVTNESHKVYYESFLRNQSKTDKGVHLVSDGSSSNETRSGAVACMALGSQNLGKGDILFLAGDTLFERPFEMDEMISRFGKLKEENAAVCLLVSAPVKPENVSKHGIIEVDHDGRVTNFLEKPQLHETSSRLQSPCCYLMSRPCVDFIEEFLKATKEKPLSARDATGNFIQYLLPRAPVFTFPVRRRFDIGNLESYIECCHYYL